MTFTSATFSEEAIARFWGYVAVSAPSDCWAWQGKIDRLGYGRFQVKKYRHGAHRYALYLATESAFPGKTGIHAIRACDNPCCVNPHHLRWGTRRDNLQDAAAKGRLHAQRLTHCPAGHPYSGDNLYVTPNGARTRKECRRQSTKRARLRRANREIAA